MQEIAYEEGKRVRKKIKTNVATSSNDERSVISGSDDEEDKTDSKMDI